MGFLFGSTPKPAAPTRMPAPDDAQAKAAQARSRRAIMSRSGRSSTVLTRDENPNGGGGNGTQSYTNSLLGQAG